MGHRQHAHHTLSCLGIVAFGISFIFLGTATFWSLFSLGIFLIVLGAVCHAARRRRCRDQYVCSPCHEDGQPTYIAVPQPYYPQSQAYTVAYQTPQPYPQQYVQPYGVPPQQPYQGVPPQQPYQGVPPQQPYQGYPPPYAPQ